MSVCNAINCTLRNKLERFFSRLKKCFGKDMQIVVILSRSQRVKNLISSRTLLSRLFKPVAYTETTCVPDLSIELVAQNHTSAWKYDILRNEYKILQSFTKMLFSLVWWQVWNIDSYLILTKGSLRWICQIIIDSTVVSKNIGQVFGISLHWKPNVVMTPTLSSTSLSLWWKLVGTTVMTMLALRQFSISCITIGLVNPRFTIAIHCLSQRFLVSESLSYYRVLYVLDFSSGDRDNSRRLTLNNESIFGDKWVTSVWIVLAR